jgi:hypothetical protein
MMRVGGEKMEKRALRNIDATSVKLTLREFRTGIFPVWEARILAAQYCPCCTLQYLWNKLILAF